MTTTQTPQVGQLLYNEHLDKDGNLKHASLLFIDTEPEPDPKSWYYTELFLMEDFGQGLEVQVSMNAGGMPASYTRIATDEDVTKFISILKQQQNFNSEKFVKDLQESQDTEPLLKEEKERIVRLMG